MVKLLLIDGHSLAFRAYHALPATMATRSGEPTNATFGFFSMLLNTLREQQPDYVAVAFDVGKTFRHQEYADYKGTRERMPDDLRLQVTRIQEIVQALNIPIFTREGYEADDVLGTLARQAEAQGVATTIVTGDRDIVQVVTDHTSVLAGDGAGTLGAGPAAAHRPQGAVGRHFRQRAGGQGGGRKGRY